MNTVFILPATFGMALVLLLCLVAGDGLQVNSEPTFPSPRLRVVCFIFNLYRLRGSPFIWDVFASNPWGRLF